MKPVRPLERTSTVGDRTRSSAQLVADGSRLATLAALFKTDSLAAIVRAHLVDGAEGFARPFAEEEVIPIIMEVAEVAETQGVITPTVAREHLVEEVRATLGSPMLSASFDRERFVESETEAASWALARCWMEHLIDAATLAPVTVLVLGAELWPERPAVVDAARWHELMQTLRANRHDVLVDLCLGVDDVPGAMNSARVALEAHLARAPALELPEAFAVRRREHGLEVVRRAP
jgi:hypothetical protein